MRELPPNSGRAYGLDPPLVATIARGSSDCCALYLKYLVEIVSGVPAPPSAPSIATLYRAADGGFRTSFPSRSHNRDVARTSSRAARRASGGALASRSSTKCFAARQRGEALLPLSRVLNAPSRRPNR